MGHVEFQRQRADISDGQSLTAGQYYYIIIKPRAALAGQCTACKVILRNGQFRNGHAKTIPPPRGGQGIPLKQATSKLQGRLYLNATSSSWVGSLAAGQGEKQHVFREL